MGPRTWYGDTSIVPGYCLPSPVTDPTLIMDVEAEMVYADILRTLQSSILNTNVSFTLIPKWGSCCNQLLRLLHKCGPQVKIENIMQALVCNSQKSGHHTAIEINRACFSFILSVLTTIHICIVEASMKIDRAVFVSCGTWGLGYWDLLFHLLWNLSWWAQSLVTENESCLCDNVQNLTTPISDRRKIHI